MHFQTTKRPFYFFCSCLLLICTFSTSFFPLYFPDAHAAREEQLLAAFAGNYNGDADEEEEEGEDEFYSATSINDAENFSGSHCAQFYIAKINKDNLFSNATYQTRKNFVKDCGKRLGTALYVGVSTYLLAIPIIPTILYRDTSGHRKTLKLINLCLKNQAGKVLEEQEKKSLHRLINSATDCRPKYDRFFKEKKVRSAEEVSSFCGKIQFLDSTRLLCPAVLKDGIEERRIKFHIKGIKEMFCQDEKFKARVLDPFLESSMFQINQSLPLANNRASNLKTELLSALADYEANREMLRSEKRQAAEECSICLGLLSTHPDLDLELQNKGIAPILSSPDVLSCTHVFHQACLDPWLENHHNCPNCRAPIKKIYKEDMY
jgi:hypothetical protein